MVTAGSSLASWLRTAASDLRDWLIPPTCAYCGVPIGPAVPILLCGKCRAAIDEPIVRPCARCAMPQPFDRFVPDLIPDLIPDLSGDLLPGHASGQADGCRWCRRHRYRFAGAVAFGAYRRILRTAVIRGKQDHWEPLTRTMAALLSEKLVPFTEEWNCDAIIPIPSHWRRRLKRATNGAEILAESIGKTLEIPIVRRRLVCRRLAGKQGTLTPNERRQNVRNVFQVAQGYQPLDGLNILLVDDVMTTGATVDEATRTLMAAGAAAVFVAVVARGVGTEVGGVRVPELGCRPVSVSHDDVSSEME